MCLASPLAASPFTAIPRRLAESINMSQELLTVAQFKERYQISHTSFYRQVKAGTLRTIKIGASTRVRLADAQAWLASLSGGAA